MKIRNASPLWPRLFFDSFDQNGLKIIEFKSKSPVKGFQAPLISCAKQYQL